MGFCRDSSSFRTHLLGAITQIREWAQQAVDNNTNRDIWELARLLFTPAVCQVLHITQPKPWVPPGEGEFAFQTEDAATYKEHRLQKRENPYQDPRPAQLHLTAAQQDTLKAINEKIAERARLSKKLQEEALEAQRERDELVAQSAKNREFVELREHMLKLVGNTGIQIPELSVSLVTARGEAVDESDIHMTEEPESSTPLPTKKGKSLRVKGSSKSSKKAPANSSSPSTTSVEGAGTQSPTGRIETLKAAKKKLANCGRAATPEPQNTI